MQQLDFQYLEDQKFFEQILGHDFSKELFDFRDPAIKRKEFNEKKNELMNQIKKVRELDCQLKLLPNCSDKKVLDHFVPLSSNELNKKLRNCRAEEGKKVITQSFGSNHPDNLLIACEKCNAHKKHRFIARDTDDSFYIINVSDFLER